MRNLPLIGLVFLCSIWVMLRVAWQTGFATFGCVACCVACCIARLGNLFFARALQHLHLSPLGEVLCCMVQECRAALVLVKGLAYRKAVSVGGLVHGGASRKQDRQRRLTKCNTQHLRVLQTGDADQVFRFGRTRRVYG